MHRGKAKIGKKSEINMLRDPLLKKESKNIRLLPFPDIAACLNNNSCTFSRLAHFYLAFCQSLSDFQFLDSFGKLKLNAIEVIKTIFL